MLGPDTDSLQSGLNNIFTEIAEESGFTFEDISNIYGLLCEYGLCGDYGITKEVINSYYDEDLDD